MGILLYPEGYVPSGVKIPEQTINDLQLDRLAASMSYSNYYTITAAELAGFWTDDAAVIRWRQAVMSDIIGNPVLENVLSRLLDCVDGWETRSGNGKMKRGLDEMAVGLNLEDFSFLDTYLKKIDSVYNDFKDIRVSSEGLSILKNKIRDLRSCERFESVKKSFEELCAGGAAPEKMRLGFNLDTELRPSRLKLLYMEPYTGDEADKNKNKKDKKRRMLLPPYAIGMSGMLLHRSVGSISQAINGFITRETMELRLLKKDLIFFLSALKQCRLWEEKGLPHCFPEIRPMEAKAFSAHGMFDPLLALNDREEIIGNDIEFQEGGEILILTGANQGGKTVFLLSVALTQWFFQLGIMAPCKSASLSPVREILTVFAPNSDTVNRKGLLAEEAQRIAAAVNAVSGSSLVLFNEPLTSTSPSETREISLEVISAF
jgi:hypothetical protein